MRLKYVTGCTCTSLQVDGKEFNIDLTAQDRIDVCKKILPITTSSKIFGDIIYYNHIMSSKDFADLNWEKSSVKQKIFKNNKKYSNVFNFFDF